MSTPLLTGSQALPAPGFEMDDGAAADWLDALADVYPRGDAFHIRELAKRLADQHREGMEETRAKLTERDNEIASLESTIDGLEWDLSEAETSLTDARDRLRELKS